MISKDIFFRLVQVCEVRTLKELSNMYGHNDNWATNARKREAIPFDICAKVSQEKGVSMDYLLFGIKQSADEPNKCQITIMDGVFRAEKKGLISILDADISNIAQVIIGDIK